MVIRRSIIGASTFGDFLTTVVHKILRQTTDVSATSALFALDSYTFDGSPKGALQAQRGGKSCPVYAELSPAGTAPTSWTAFLSRWQTSMSLAERL